MAEFQEVMRQAQRMCDYRRKHNLECGNCDAAHICGLKIRHVGLDTLCADADAVMLWAAEHPVVYPTWYEYLSDYYRAAFGDMFVISKQPIPADIAQKLGIEPKENGHGA